MPGSMNPNQFTPAGPRLTHHSSSSATSGSDVPIASVRQQQQQMFLVQQTARPAVGPGFGAPRLAYTSPPQPQQYMTMVPANVMLGRHHVPSHYQAISHQQPQRMVLVPEQLHQYPPQFAEQIQHGQQKLSYPISSPSPFGTYAAPSTSSVPSAQFHHPLLVSTPAPPSAFPHHPLMFQQQTHSQPQRQPQVYPDPQTQMIAHVKRMTDPVLKRLKAASSASSSVDSEPEERKRRKRESEGSRRTNLNDLVSVVEQAVLKDMNRMDRFADKVTVLECTVRLLQDRYGLKPSSSSQGANPTDQGGEDSDDASSSVSALDADLSGPALDRNTKKTLRERRRRRAMNRHLTTLRQLLHLEGGTEKKAILNAVIDFLAEQNSSSSTIRTKPESTDATTTIAASVSSNATVSSPAASPSKVLPQAASPAST